MGSRRVCMLLHKSVEHDSRVRREAAALAAAGWEVTVLELAPEGGALPGFARRSVLPPARLRRVLPPTAYRLLGFAAFVAAVVRLRPAVVHAHDAAMLIPGLLGARSAGARLVYDSHELATGVPYRAGRWQALVRRIESVGVPRADAVVTVSDGIAERLQVLYGLHELPTVVRNTTELRRPAAGDAVGGLRARLGIPAGAPLVLHQGAAAPDRGCETLIRAVAGLPGEVRLVFLGSALPAFDAELARLADDLGAAHRIHLHPSVPLPELLANTREADVGVSLLQNTCENHRLALPNKVFEYLAAGVPVVTSDLPELRRLVVGSGIGWTVDGADPDAVASALRLALASAGEPALGERLRAADAAASWDGEAARLTRRYSRL